MNRQRPDSRRPWWLSKMDADRERAERLLVLLEGLIRSNLDLAQEVRELRQTLQKAAGLAGLLKTLGVSGRRR